MPCEGWGLINRMLPLRTLCRGVLPGLLVALVACTSLQRLPADWALDAREQKLMAITQWHMSGKLGVRAPHDSASLYVDWRQADDAYEIQLSGPMGQGGGSISGDAAGVSLHRDGQVRRAASAEALVQQAFGWQLPMGALRYWVRGLPAPGLTSRAALERNAQGLLVSQEQAGWVLEYSHYKLVQGQALPGKLKAESTRLGLRLVLIVNDWKLEAES
jgi:outer membrane lipoprotein LolB